MEQENKEIMELKQQLEALQGKLDSMVEINEKAIKSALGGKMDKLSSLGVKSVLICVFGLIFVEAVILTQGVSTAFLVGTAIFLGLNALVAYLLSRCFMTVDTGMDMISVVKKLLRFKKYNRLSTFVGVPIALLWMVWYAFELKGLMDMENDLVFIVMIACMAIGFVIGGTFGLVKFYIPSMKAADEVIEQINELEKQ